MTILRLPLESSGRGKSRSAWSIFVKFIFDLFFQNNFPNNAQTKIDHADLDSRSEVSDPSEVSRFVGLVKEVKLSS